MAGEGCDSDIFYRKTAPGEGNGSPLQYSCLQNPMDRGAWQAKSMRSQRVGQDWAAKHAHTHRKTEGTGSEGAANSACWFDHRICLIHPQGVFHCQPPHTDQSEYGYSGCILHSPSGRHRAQIHSGLLTDITQRKNASPFLSTLNQSINHISNAGFSGTNKKETDFWGIIWTLCLHDAFMVPVPAALRHVRRTENLRPWTCFMWKWTSWVIGCLDNHRLQGNLLP